MSAMLWEHRWAYVLQQIVIELGPYGAVAGIDIGDREAHVLGTGQWCSGMESEMTKISFEVDVVELKINGQPLILDPAKVDESWFATLFAYGARRYPNDKFSGETDGNAKFEAVRGLIASMAEPMPERVAGAGSAPKDPIEALAVRNAKADLLAAFKTRTGKMKIEDMLADKAVAKFFANGKNGPVWIEASVEAWMTKRLAAGKSYLDEATAMIDGAASDLLDI